MNDKPARDDYNQLIDQLGSSNRESGPDILAVNHRKEESHAAAQPPRRTVQHTAAADQQRRQASSHSRTASSRAFLQAISTS